MTTSCEPYRSAISAKVDGEPPEIDPLELDEHLRDCAGCRRFAETATAMRRRSRIRPATEVPDLSGAVIRRTAAHDRSTAAWMARWLLALVAAQIVVLSLPDLFASDQDAHADRHLGAFALAYAVGLIVVVARPARARTMLHVAIVLAGAMVVTAVVDITQGRVPLVNEAVHIPELFSVLFLWILARPRSSTPEVTRRDVPEWDGSVTDPDAEEAEVRPLRPRSSEG